MKKHILTSIFIGSALAMASSLLFAAEQTGGNMTKVLEDLKAKGYSIVKKIEFDKNDGLYNAKVANAEGKNLNIKINANTGEMTKPENAVEGLTALEIAKKVEGAGNGYIIYKIDTDMFGDKYEVNVLDANGKKLDLKVDAKTGAIIKSKTD